MAKIVKYKVLGNSNLSDFVSFGLDLSNANVSVRNDGDVVFTGAGGMDAVYVGPYIHSFDFTASADLQDVLYLSGNKSDYSVQKISATQLLLTNTQILLPDGSRPTITMAVGNSAISSDIVVFKDAAYNTLAISDALTALTAVGLGTLTPVVVTGSTESNLRTPTDPSTLADVYATSNVTIKARGNNEGNTFATVPGGKATLVVYGGNGIDVVYVQPYTKVDAINLNGGIDRVYLTGRFSDYQVTGSGNIVTLTRSQGTQVETLKVKGGTGFTGSIDSLSYDQLVFTDGWLRSADVYLAALNGRLDTLRPNTELTTPGLLSEPVLSLVDAVVGGATHDEATAAAGVLRVSANSGSTVNLTFADRLGHTLTKQLAATGAFQLVTLAASDLGAGSHQLSDGTITVNAMSRDASGKQSNVRSLNFSLDGSAPGAPSIVPGANVTDPVSREEALGSGLLKLKAETSSILKVTLTDKSGHSVVRSFIGQGTDAADTPVSLGLTAAELGTGSNQLAEGQITVTAFATDAAGNKGAESNPYTFQLDYNAPATPEGNVNRTFPDANIGLAEATSTDGVIFVQAESGSVITVLFHDLHGHTVPRTVTGLGAVGVPVQLAASDLGTGSSQLDDGTITVTAKAKDAAGNESEPYIFHFELDTVAPAAPSFALGLGVDDGATAAEATASGGVISITAEQGSNVRVIFSNGTSEVVKNVTGRGDGTAVGVVLTAQELAVFGNNYSGDITVRAQATGTAGNPSLENSTTFTLDRLAPAALGLDLVSDTGTANDGITSNPQIRITGLETFSGTRWRFRVDGGAEQTGSAAIAADGSSTLNATPGSHQYQVWQLDKAGNQGAVNNLSVNFLDGPPTVQILSDRNTLLRSQTATLTIRFNQDIGNTLALGDFNYSGGTLSNLQAGADPLVYTALFTPNADSSGTASVTLGAMAVTNLAGSSNVSGASISLPFNTTGPAKPEITLVNEITGGATLAEATASTGIVKVQAESGTSVHVIFRDQLGREVVRDFTGNGSTGVWVTLAASELGAGANRLSKGAIQITATATNAAGNSSDIQVKAFNFDPDPPADAVLTLASGLGNDISGTRATAAGGLLSLVAESGSTVQIFFRKGSDLRLSRTLTGNGNTPVWLTLAASELGTGAGKLQDGAITVTAQVFDAAGNQAGSNTLNFVIDSTLPTPPTLQLVDTLVSRSEALGSVLTINSEPDSQMHVVFTYATFEQGHSVVREVVRDYRTGVNGTHQISLLNTDFGTASNQLADGEIRVQVTSTDAVGNSSSNSTTFTLDTTAPANPAVPDMGPGVTGDVSRNEALAADGVLSLKAELNSTINVTLSDTSGHSVVRALTGRGTTAVPLVLTATDLGGATGLAEGTITVLATVTDAAGNPAASSASRTFFLDTIKPSQPQLAVALEAQAGATLADATATGIGTVAGGVISVRADSGSTVRVTFSDGTRTIPRTLIGTNTVQWVTLAASEIGNGAGQLHDGTITVTAVATDAAGNDNAADSKTFTLDTNAPNQPSIDLGSGLTSGQVLSRSKALQAAGVLAVSAESGTSVAVTFTDSADHKILRNFVAGASATALALAAGELGTDIGHLGNGTITVRAKATDTAGNEGPERTFTFDLDATAPNAPSIPPITGGVVSRSKATQAAGVIALTAESSSQVVLTLTDKLGHQIPRTFAAGASASAITLAATELGTNAGQLSDGTITVSAYATDAAGNDSLTSSFSFTLDTTAATPTITLGNGVTGVVSLAEAIRAGGVIRVAAEAGDQISLTFTDSAPQSHSVIRSFTAAGMANPLGIALNSTNLGGTSGLANGTINVRAEATDAVGNTSSVGTFSFDLDITPTVVPTPRLAVGVSDPVSRSEALLVSGVLQVEVAVADIGSWVELTLTDKLGNQVGRNFTANAATTAITLAATDLGTGVGKLSDGNINVTVRATDPAGNSSLLGSSSFFLDTAVLPPSMDLSSGVTGDVSKDEATRASGVVQVTTETGSTVVLTFTPEHGDPVMRTVQTTGAATSVAVTLAASELGTGVGQLDSGNITVTAVGRDLAGNDSLTSSFSFTLDIDAPAMPSISPGAGITGLTGLASRSKALQAGGVLLVSAESGSQVEVILTDRLSHSVVRTVTGSTASAITLAASDLGTGVGQLDEGDISVSAVAKDAAGNRSTAGTSIFKLDSKVAAPGITLGTGITGDVSKDEATLASGVVQVTTETGSTVVLTFTPEHGDPVMRTVQTTGAATSVAVTLAASELGTGNGQMNTGRITVSAVATDAAGNISEAGNFSFTLDIDAPNPPRITPGNGVMGDVSRSEALQAGGVVQVSAESGSQVKLTFTDKSGHTVTRPFTAGSAASAITLADTDLGTGGNQLSDGTITVSASATDVAGNKGEAGTFTFTLDSKVAAPGITLGTGVTGDVSKDEATLASGVVQVTTETGSTVVLTFTPEPGHGGPVMRTVHTTGAATSVAVTLAASELGTGEGQLDGGNISVSAVATDAAGNTSTAGSFTFTLDIAAPNPPSITPGNGVVGDVSRSEALQAGGVIQVSAESGSQVKLTFTDKSGHTVTRPFTAGSAASAITLADSDLGTGINQLDDGTITVSATATDTAGNLGNAGTFSFKLDSKAPAAATLTYSNGVITVMGEEGSTISLTLTDGDSPAHSVTRSITLLGSTTGTLALTTQDLAALTDGTINVSSTTRDTAGNSTSGMGSFTLARSNIQVPAPDLHPSNAVLDGASRTEALAGVLEVGGNSGHVLTLTLTDSLSHQVTRTITAGSSASTIALDASELGSGAGQLKDGTITVTAVASDAANHASGASTITFKLDTQVLPPSFSLGSGVSDAVSKDEATRASGVVQVTTETGSTVVLTFTPKPGHGSPVMRTVHTTGAATSVAVALASSELGTDTGQMSGDLITVSAVATDAAGNISTAGSFTFTLDIDAPDAPSIGLGAGIVGAASRNEALQQVGVLLVSAESGSQLEVTLTDRLSHSVVRTVTGSTASAITLAASELGTGVGQLDDGDITVSAVATDAAGNRSNAGTRTFTLDSSDASPAIIPGTGVSGDVSKDEATLGSGVLQITAENGSQVTVTFTDKHSHSVVRTVTATGAASPITLVASELGTGVGQLDSGNITVTAVGRDLAGNDSLTSSFSFTLDIDAPAMPSISPGAGITGLTGLASRSKALQAGGVLLVSAESGSQVEVILTDRLSHSVVRTVTGSTASAITLAASDLGTGVGQLDEGDISVSAVAKDAAGNRSTAGTSIFKLDSKVAAPGITLGTGITGDVSKDEATLASGVVQVTTETGSTVVLTFTPEHGDPVMRTVQTTGAATSVAVTLAASELGTGNGQMNTGRITVSAVATDAAGNISEAGNFSFTLDIDAPNPPRITPGNGVMGDVSRSEALQAGGVVQVSAESGSQVKLTFTDKSGHTVTRPFTAGSAASAITLADTDLGTGGNQLSDGTITVSAVAKDVAGNKGEAGTFTFTLDSAIAPPSIVPAPGVTGDVSKNEATLASGVLQVTAESGSTVVLTLTDKIGHLVNRTVTAGASASTITLSASELGTDIGQLQDGTINVTSVATDVAGNRTEAGSFSFTINTQAPDAPVLEWDNAISNGATRAEATTSLLGIYAQSGSTVLVTFTDTNPNHNYSVTRSFTGLGSSAVAITLAASEIGSGNNQLGEGNIQVSVTSTDAVGNSTTVTSSFQLDITPPADPIPTLTPDLANGGTLSEVTVATGLLGIQANSGSTVNVTFSDTAGHSLNQRGV